MTEPTTDLVYKFICSYLAEHKFPPTLQEIADGVGRSKSSVSRTIEILEAQGRVTRTAHSARTVLPLR